MVFSKLKHFFHFPLHNKNAEFSMELCRFCETLLPSPSTFYSNSFNDIACLYYTALWNTFLLKLKPNLDLWGPLSQITLVLRILEKNALLVYVVYIESIHRGLKSPKKFFEIF